MDVFGEQFPTNIFEDVFGQYPKAKFEEIAGTLYEEILRNSEEITGRTFGAVHLLRKEWSGKVGFDFLHAIQFIFNVHTKHFIMGEVGGWTTLKLVLRY